MRYVSINQLKSGMILGQEIYDASGQLLLEKYTPLSDDNISFMLFVGVQGVYVDDEFSRDVQVHEIVQPEIKKNALKAVGQYFKEAAEGEIPDSEARIVENVQFIVQDVLNNEDVMYNMIELRTYDDYTYFHSTNVAILAGVIGAKCGFDERDLADVVTAGFLHDIGKVFIDPEIITAPRQLTAEEKLKMRDHPTLGYEFLEKNYNFNEAVKNAVYEHHEWYNGNGYPRRMSGNEIQPISRVLRLADVFDAMTGRRAYHAPYLPSDVMEYIMARSGMEFDPDFVDVMARELCIYPVGCEVELSDGRHALVVENHRGYILRPTVKLIDNGEYIDLCEDRSSWNLTITKLLM